MGGMLRHCPPLAAGPRPAGISRVRANLFRLPAIAADHLGPRQGMSTDGTFDVLTGGAQFERERRNERVQLEDVAVRAAGRRARRTTGCKPSDSSPGGWWTTAGSTAVRSAG